MIPVVGGEGLPLLERRYWLIDFVPLHRISNNSETYMHVCRVHAEDAQIGMAIAVMILRRFRVARLHVLAVVDTVACRLDLIEGMSGDPMPMEDTTYGAAR